MNNPYNKEEVRKKFLANPLSKQKAVEALESEWFNDWLACTLSMCSPYTPNCVDSDIPHIQSERNGGMKAINKLVSILTKIPFREYEDNSNNKDEYIGHQSHPHFQRR